MVIIIVSVWRQPQEVRGRNEALVGGVPACFMLQDHMITQKPLVSNNLMENTSNFFVPGAYLICLKNLKKVECNLADNKKMAGGFRRDSGHEMYCSILTIIETLKKREMGIIENVKKLFMGTPAIF